MIGKENRSIEGSLKRILRWGRRIVEVFTILILLFLVYNIFYPYQFKVDYSTLITDSDGDIVHAFLNNDDKWRMYIEQDEISDNLKKAFIEKEDQYFYWHPGVNPLALGRALVNNLLQQRRTSGASTITMQVVRLLEPKKRTYANKFKEIIQAMQLELRHSKDEIFNMYLNLVPYGGNIEGVKSMSVLYFNKLPLQLSLSECMALAVIPNRPSSLRPGKNNPLITEVKNEWLNRFATTDIFPEKEIETALNEDFTAKRRPTPKRLPHLSYRLKRQYAHLPNIETTVDLSLQSNAEKLISSYSESLRYRDINNLSAMVIDNQTGDVLVYVGSSDFYDQDNAGQVDGIKAIRSPGSTLKPFLYAKAFDKGLITPLSQLYDLPLNIYGYEPENYDGDYHGKVSATHALAQSLNIPAVKLLRRHGIDDFIASLSTAGFDQIKSDKQKLGLSVILGGCGVSLENLCVLYRSFANDGVRLPLRYTTDENQDQLVGDTLLSPLATSMLNEVLTQVQRPDLPLAWQSAVNLPAVAWKTGTSYGRKDAWSIGYNKDYTIGVWVGNFDSRGVPDLSGASAAAPILFQLFNMVDRKAEKHWYQRDANVKFREVCAYSGQVPGQYCDQMQVDQYIPGVSATLPCEHLKKVWVNPDSTLSYCMTCRPDDGYVEAVFPNLKQEMISWNESRQIGYLKIPPHNSACDRVFHANEPLIDSPVADMTYLVDIVDSTEITLHSHTHNDVEQLHWYVNDKFLQSAAANEKVYIFPPKGHIKVSCVDDKGRMSHVKCQIKYVNF